MPKSANTLLALSPGTREFGVAVFEEIDLLYYAVKDLVKRREGNTMHSLDREAVRVVEEIIHKYQPASGVIIRTLHPLQQMSPKLVHLATQLKTASQRQGLSVREYAPAEARKLLCVNERATRRNAAARLATLYPELGRYVVGVSHWQRLYYEPMFDAIAIGYCRQQEATRELARYSACSSDPQFSDQARQNPSTHPHANS